MQSTRLARRHRPARPEGFTLIEMVVVVGIIGILAAVALPAIGTYIRNYTIRGAAEQVAGEIQTAKLLAIKKNVNFGVVFVVLSDSTYQYFIEDGTPAGMRQTYAAAQQGPVRTLPSGVQFVLAVPGPDVGLRFNRLGVMCDPDAGTALTCPDLAGSGIAPAPTGNYVGFDSANPEPTLQGAVVNLTQPTTGVTRTVVVSSGGRVHVLNR